jgi:hypothetical protein
VGGVFSPLDQQLRLWEKHWSEQVAKQAVWLSGLVTFAEAEQILREVGRINMSQSSIWRRVERWGGRLQAVEAIQQAKAYGFEEPEAIDPNHSLGRMGAAMDGTMIHIREEGWKELKAGCVFDIAQRCQLDHHTQEEVELGSAINNSYVAHLGGPEVFGRQLWAEARQRLWMHAEDTLTLGDGASWIWNLVGEHFYDSHQMVDWYHATEHLASVAKTLHDEGTPAARRWYRRWETKLYQGQVDQLVQALKHQAKLQPKKEETLRKEAGYFHNNRKRMNYLEMRSEGYPIGSGMVESAAKQYKARFCGPGMRWSRNGAERLLPVRTAIMSHRFDKMWRLAYISPPN